MKKWRRGRSLVSGVLILCMVMSFCFGGVTAVCAEERTFTVTGQSLFVCGGDGVITAFAGSKDITELVVPVSINGISVKGIGDNVFAGFDKLSIVVLPNTLERFGNSVFSGCVSLNTMSGYDGYNADGNSVTISGYTSGVVTLPDSLNYMGTGVFSTCKAISRFAVADSNLSFKAGTWDSSQNNTQNQDSNVSGEATLTRSQGEMLLSKDGTVLYRFAPAFHYTGQGFYSLPAGLRTISAYACESVGLNGGFVIPNTITSIGDYGFYEGGNLNEIQFETGSQLTTIGAYAFARNANLTLVLPSSVTTIGTYVFAYITNRTPDISATQITVVPEYAFYECDNLHAITMPASLKSIEAYAFYGCNNLNNIYFLGETLEKIGTGAFQTCNNLHEIVIPSGVTAIEDNTFDGCQNLNKIVLPDTVTTIGENAFKDCQNIHEMVIPASVTYIANSSFSGAKMDEIDTSNNAYSQKFIKGNLPEKGATFTVGTLKYTVTKSDATKGTVSVSGVTSKKIKSATIGKTVLYKGYTFKITAIADNAFKSCKKLQKVTIGANVTKIGKNAFYKDSKLKNIQIKSAKLKSVGKNAIKGIAKKATVKVPKKQYKKYKKLFKKSTGFKKPMKIKK